MVVKLVLAIRDGWKQIDNQRFGQCMEVRFVNTVDNKVMFRYAPNLKDEDFFVDMFNTLRQYDKLHKQIYSLAMLIEGESIISSGTGLRVTKDDPVESKAFGKMGDTCD